MDDELRRLLRKANRIAATGEQLSAQFALELARVWKDAERALRQLLLAAPPGSLTAAIAATRAVALRDQVRGVLERAGYDALVVRATRSGAEALIAASLSAATAAEIASFTASAGATIEAMRRLAAVDLFQQGDEVATAVWRSMAQHLFTARPVRDIVQDLADALDDDEAAVRTLFDTQMSIFGRQVEHLATEGLGPDQPFIYFGPVDLKTRDFCLERVGQVFTRRDIDEMDNGQLGAPFLTAGGWNCRHSWLAVESQELREKAGTGWRADPAAEDVERVRQEKAERKAKRQKGGA